MSPEAQRKAIMEALGWDRRQAGAQVWYESTSGFIVRESDLLNDLNAIHAAILALIVRGPAIVPCCSNESLFDAQLDLICDREEVPMWQFGADLYCEGLLKTLGLWMEDAP